MELVALSFIVQPFIWCGTVGALEALDTWAPGGVGGFGPQGGLGLVGDIVSPLGVLFSNSFLESLLNQKPPSGGFCWGSVGLRRGFSSGLAGGVVKNSICFNCSLLASKSAALSSPQRAVSSEESQSSPSASSLALLELGGDSKVGISAGEVVVLEVVATEEGEVVGAHLELEVEVGEEVVALVDGVVGDARLEVSVKAAVMVDTFVQLRSFNVGEGVPSLVAYGKGAFSVVQP